MRPAGKVLNARLHLLDRQVLDVDAEPVVTVDDLELTAADGSDWPDGSTAVHVSALLSGPVLATRIVGGRPPRSRWHEIAWAHVTDVGVTLRLGVHGDSLDVTWTERWVREHVVGRLPGGRHDPG